MIWLAYVLVAVLSGCGAAVVLVEKKDQWPATAIRPLLTKLLGKIYHKLPEMLNCTVCTSFWTTLFAELWISAYTKFDFFPIWPLSGLISIAFTWSFIMLLNAIDPQSEEPKLPQ